MNILAVGDVVGAKGCDILRRHLHGIKKINGADICIVNGENSAQGNGITHASVNHILDSGADLVTTGNHVFKRNEVYEYLNSGAPVIRPANYSGECPGKGHYIIDKGRIRVGVINLMGTMYMEPLQNPFECIDRELTLFSECKIILVDFHAEATSEKRAMGFYLDGRVSALFGTHTHVQTSDEQILPKGTGYITDLGMTGPKQSVLGVKPDIIISKFKNHMPARFDYDDSECMINGCLFCVDEKTGKTTDVKRISIE